MITTIAKRFTFDAAHHLPMMPDGHKCRRLHGHTYEVELVLRGRVDAATGILLDYAAIGDAWTPVYDRLDHHNLNDVPGLHVPTTENLVAWMFKWFYTHAHPAGTAQFWSLLHSIRIKESSTTWCEMNKVEWLAFCGDLS